MAIVTLLLCDWDRDDHYDGDKHRRRDRGHVPKVRYCALCRFAAFVRQRPGHSLTEAELDAFCRRHLASYKVPRIWRFVDQFPQTASGKIQKFLLREQLPPG
jgi:hypothetical protein